MACDEDVVKCLVFWANFFLALVGISILSVGIVYKINLEEFTYVIPKDYQNVPVIPMLTVPLGSVIIAAAVFGCYGCITERSTILTIYGVILLVIFLVQFGAGVFALCQMRDETRFGKELNATLEKVFENYYENQDAVDLIQHRLKCCGLNGSTYWTVIPNSCYEFETKNLYRESCPMLVFSYLENCIQIVGITIIILSLTEVSGSVISLTFVSYLRHSYRYNNAYHFPENEIL